jgi:hypothetical protein
MGWVEAGVREKVFFPGAFKTYTNLWEGRNLVIEFFLKYIF